jgi:two-component system response regulator BaeR
MNTPANILIVEDDLKIAMVLLDYLNANGYRARYINDGVAALELLQNESVDLILLDRMLPGMDGISLMQEVRKFSTVPIIMLTAMIDETDRLTGLDAGADDYVCKPFSPREVVARVNAQLRRNSTLNVNPNSAPETKFFEVNDATISISIKGKTLPLTPVEFKILAELIKHPSRVFTRQQLLNAASEDYRESGDRTIDSHVKNIRKKIAAISDQSECVQSVYGIGYRFELA